MRRREVVRFLGAALALPFLPRNAELAIKMGESLHRRVGDEGSLERMQQTACTHMTAVHFVEGAGHWVQQEQPERVSELLVGFLRDYAKP